MEFDNVEAMKSVVAVGLGASIVPKLSVWPGHVPANTVVIPLSPRARRMVGLVQHRDKRGTAGLALVAAALLTLRTARPDL
jgi:DNA-binding transcriptional LysR family regulator